MYIIIYFILILYIFKIHTVDFFVNNTLLLLYIVKSTIKSEVPKYRDRCKLLDLFRNGKIY